VIDDLLLGRRVPAEDEHDGLWHANQLCDLVQMRSSSAGTTVRHPCLEMTARASNTRSWPSSGCAPGSGRT
jgi:hypothetical protein